MLVLHLWVQEDKSAVVKCKTQLPMEKNTMTSTSLGISKGNVRHGSWQISFEMLLRTFIWPLCFAPVFLSPKLHSPVWYKGRFDRLMLATEYWQLRGITFFCSEVIQALRSFYGEAHLSSTFIKKKKKDLWLQWIHCKHKSFFFDKAKADLSFFLGKQTCQIMPDS